MLKPFCQATALILLCALLVYAPEIYTAVSGPFALSTPERVLLRVVLCTQDDETLSSFYSALTEYQRSHPAVHLRIVRTDRSRITCHNSRRVPLHGSLAILFYLRRILECS